MTSADLTFDGLSRQLNLRATRSADLGKGWGGEEGGSGRPDELEGCGQRHYILYSAAGACAIFVIYFTR